MIIDGHSHTWNFPSDFSDDFVRQAGRARPGHALDLTIGYRPWRLYHSPMLAQEYGVWDNLLFGTDSPFTTVNASINGLRALNDMPEGTKLPRLDAAQIEAMIHRDGLKLLGLR